MRCEHDKAITLTWAKPGTIEVKIELIPGGVAPFQAPDSDGWDLSARLPEKEVVIRPGEWLPIGLGVKIQPPAGYHTLLFIRSGVSKRELRLMTGVSVIDHGYTGEIIACIQNTGNEDRVIRNGERICQLVFQETIPVKWNLTPLEETERGDGGFGSTGR